MSRTYTFQITIAEDLFDDGWTDQTLSAERVHRAICAAFPLARMSSIGVVRLETTARPAHARAEAQRAINEARVAYMVALLARDGAIDAPGSSEAERFAKALAEPVAASASVYVRPEDPE